jgi:hypothetical protein
VYRYRNYRNVLTRTHGTIINISIVSVIILVLFFSQIKHGCTPKTSISLEVILLQKLVNEELLQSAAPLQDMIALGNRFIR